jgi:hypothetical protein
VLPDWLRDQMIIAVWEGLLDQVHPALRGITLGDADRALRIRYYFHGPITEVERDAMQEVGAAIWRAQPKNCELKEAFMRSDVPEEMECLGMWGFLRRRFDWWR